MVHVKSIHILYGNFNCFNIIEDTSIAPWAISEAYLT